VTEADLDGSADPDGSAVSRLEDALSRLAVQVAGRARTGRTHEDADDISGTVDTDDALAFNPLPLLRAFDEHGARVAVIGQVAGIMHGSAELTGDLDLLWDGDPDQAPKLAMAFAEVHAELADDDGVPQPCGAAAFALPKVTFRSTQACGDCCTPALPWGELPVALMLSRCHVVLAAPGFRIRYLARQDLIQMRLAAARPKDLRRAEELSRAAEHDAAELVRQPRGRRPT
jgi:hypothetical protein